MNTPTRIDDLFWVSMVTFANCVAYNSYNHTVEPMNLSPSVLHSFFFMHAAQVPMLVRRC